MTRHRGVLLGARLLFNVFFLATSLYCLLAYVPFSYSQFVKDNLVPGLSMFAKLNPYLYWGALLAGAFSIASDLQQGPARQLARMFVGLGVAAGHAAWEDDALRARPVLVSAMLFALLQAIAIGRYADEVAWGDPAAWIYMLTLLGLLAVGAPAIPTGTARAAPAPPRTP